MELFIYMAKMLTETNVVYKWIIIKLEYIQFSNIEIHCTRITTNSLFAKFIIIIIYFFISGNWDFV